MALNYIRFNCVHCIVKMLMNKSNGKSVSNFGNVVIFAGENFAKIFANISFGGNFYGTSYTSRGVGGWSRKMQHREKNAKITFKRIKLHVYSNVDRCLFIFFGLTIVFQGFYIWISVIKNTTCEEGISVYMMPWQYSMFCQFRSSGSWKISKSLSVTISKVTTKLHNVQRYCIIENSREIYPKTE